ncbi:MAG: hypothetical protein JJU34_19610 [Lunatimonas sp.]|uniref:hypothetical protein n=1 Tax=Lunatimonas sp. TaxID=2060141 RepID=UPI00263AB514|nr:hypothetical protein [Lunatimonas sp.]MCC5939495.1 hypothetical protein [Lunatimonas sp.]
MRKTLLILLFLGIAFVSDAKDKKEKTFLVIFDKEELRLHSTSSTKIELNFLDNFQTKSYAGNSDAALLITVPFEEWDACDIGKALVIVGNDRLVKLEEVAFRIIDLKQTDNTYAQLLSKSTEEAKNSKKKVATVKLTL